MKQKQLLRLLMKNGCVLKRGGRSHSLWMNIESGIVEAVPRHSEISDMLAKKILKNLDVSQ